MRYRAWVWVRALATCVLQTPGHVVAQERNCTDCGAAA